MDSLTHDVPFFDPPVAPAVAGLVAEAADKVLGDGVSDPALDPFHASAILRRVW